MIGMETRALVFDRWVNGCSKSEIARLLSIDRKTVDRILREEDYSIGVESFAAGHRGSKLDKYKPHIDALLEEERTSGIFRKQRWTARRMHEYLVDGCGHEELRNSYHLVARYMRSKRNQRIRGYEEKGGMPLVWHPGEAQADFGEADCRIGGDDGLARMKFLVMAFPYSNRMLAVFLPGENCECVCQGLQYMFEFLGKVPSRIVFDNATGIGRRVSGTLRENEGFTRFRLHYRFAATFANPRSGWEKGSVENAVGTFRRNRMVPPRRIHTSVEEYNRAVLLPESFSFRADEIHYRKGETRSGLFEKDAAAMHELPASMFRVSRIEWHTLDNTGTVLLDGSHRYSVGPQKGGSAVIIEKTAWEIRIHDEKGALIKAFTRLYGDGNTNTYDLEAMAMTLHHKPGSWMNSPVREGMADGPLKSYIDSMGGSKERRRFFWSFKDIVEKFSLGETCFAYNSLMRDGKVPGKDDVEAYCMRLRMLGPENAENPTGIDLGMYDALLSKEAQ